MQEGKASFLTAMQERCKFGDNISYLKILEILKKDTEQPSFQGKVENDILWHKSFFSTFTSSRHLQWLKSRLSNKSE